MSKKIWAAILGILPKSPSVHERFLELKSTYQIAESQAVSDELQRIMDTSSPISDVLSSMDAFFDREYYLQTNEDVRISGLDPSLHYLLWGWKENRPPSVFFDVNYYRNNNTDLTEKEFPLAHYLEKSRERTVRIHPIGGRRWFTPKAPTEAQWLNSQPATRSTETEGVVVIPVYDGFDDTLACIYRALASRGQDKYSVLVIDDHGPNSELRSIIHDLHSKGLFDLHDNEVNLGFVKSVNCALRDLTDDLDVVLLNSDAYVFPGWFGRLRQHALRDNSIATITPLSNNATICSYPIYNANNFHSLELEPEQLDILAAQANKGLSSEAPTGVGFCFYIRRSAIERVGLLDEEAFKIGYGEENDFCMRAYNLGMRNLIAGDVFVYHTGSVSFSSVGNDHYSHGQQKLTEKHPNYEVLVHNHIVADPERVLRQNLDAARLIEVSRGSTVIISHSWGGGIETYITQYKDSARVRNENCVVMRVHDRYLASFEDGGPNALSIPNLKNIDLRTNLNFVEDLLTRIAPKLIHVNSLVGLDWFTQTKVLQILGEIEYPKTWIGHDFSPISHRYQLLRPDGVFDGIPSIAKLINWSRMNVSPHECDACDPVERIETYSKFFAKDVKIEVPSRSTSEIYKKFFPFVSPAIVPHVDHFKSEPVVAERPSNEKLVVAVVGAIGHHKGSSVLGSLAEYALRNDLPLDYNLIGYSDNDGRLEKAGVKLWGRYSNDDDAIYMISSLRPDIIFLPSIWPETFCYTLSLALKTGIPAVVFDLGAQAERVRDAERGLVLPLALAQDPAELSARLMSIVPEKIWQRNLSEPSGVGHGGNC